MDADNRMNGAPQFILDWFQAKEASDEYDCMDNYRWAREWIPAEVEQFEDAERGGCCGSCNETITSREKRYLVGFNYGH